MGLLRRVLRSLMSPPAARQHTSVLLVLGTASIPVFMLVGLFCVSMNGAEAEYRHRKERQEQEWERKREETRVQDAEKQRQRDEAARRKAEEQAIEAARTPFERANLAIAVLNGVAMPGKHGPVCRAHSLLDRITTEDRASSKVREALALLARKEAAQLLAERPAFEKQRGLLCGDGWISPCQCQGSHRGCCSHHRGVAECEPYPTRVGCPHVAD